VVAVVEPAYLCLHGPSQAPPSPPPTRPYLSPGARVALVIGGTTPLPGGHWSITTRHRPRAELDGQPWHTTAYQAYFRPTLADARPVVRTWQAGDRLLLPGLAGHKKLSDLFIDRKVPRAWRASLPLLTTASTIAWVAGLAVAEPFRATTDDVMVIECVLHADPHWPAHQ
jgi:tRNA(Ile)-lysidine synthase